MTWESDYYDSVQNGLEAVIEALEAEFGSGTFDEAARAVEEESFEEALENLAETLVELDRPISEELSEPLLEFAESVGIEGADVIVSFRAWVDDHA